MLSELHNTLRAVARLAMGASADEVDVAFDRPDRRWVDRCTRPTINLFLFDLRENLELRATALQKEPNGAANGHGTRRAPPRRFDLHYLVSAITSDPADEHAVLWRVLVTLLKHPVLPADLLPPEVRAAGVPVTARLAAPDQRPAPLDPWSALDAAPRASLVYVVTVPVDLDIAFTAPLVLTSTTRVRRDARSAGSRVRIGGVVRGRDGQPLEGAAVALDRRGAPVAHTDADGRFVLGNVLDAAAERGDVTLDVTPAGGDPAVAQVAVPSERLDAFDVTID